jgi:hypothetical protein
MAKRIRTIPIGSASAALDYHAYGAWPGAVPCKSCIGTGNFYGRDEDGDWIDCDECQGRGWNLPSGAPQEILLE